MTLIDHANTEPSELLADMDNQFRKGKEETLSRKDILKLSKEGIDQLILSIAEDLETIFETILSTLRLGKLTQTHFTCLDIQTKHMNLIPIKISSK